MVFSSPFGGVPGLGSGTGGYGSNTNSGTNQGVGASTGKISHPVQTGSQTSLTRTASSFAEIQPTNTNLNAINTSQMFKLGGADSQNIKSNTPKIIQPIKPLLREEELEVHQAIANRAASTALQAFVDYQQAQERLRV